MEKMFPIKKKKKKGKGSFPCWHLVLLIEGQVILSSIHDILYSNKPTYLAAPKGHFATHQHPTSTFLQRHSEGGTSQQELSPALGRIPPQNNCTTYNILAYIPG